ncbi:2OG-Fe(II) oxygenase [Sphingosinicella sp.]|uniref:2OG-Fe(II) oxygenase n=1 Tax=Sphingosinicella sp. TaxID=1917971 RepID=UPI0040383D7A
MAYGAGSAARTLKLKRIRFEVTRLALAAPSNSWHSATMPARHPMLQQAISLSAAGRNPEAVLIISRLAAQDEPEALALLAEMKWRGGMVPQDPVQGRELYRRASEGGHQAAAHSYTNLLANGVAGHRDWPQAMDRLRVEARKDQRRRQMLAILERMRMDDDGDPACVPDVEPLSESPHVRLFERLFTATECDYLKQVAQPGYQPSTVFDANRRLVRDPIRTSDSSTIHWLMEDPVVHALNRRLAAVTGTMADQGEAMQILRYRPGQQYRSHFDFAQSSDNQRCQTALVYLNHDYRGGETCFVRTGLKVKGRKGDALVFRSALSDRSLDPMSEHAGLPVTSGTKVIASRWIRERRWQP